MISDKFACGKKGFKYFIGYKNEGVATPLHIMLPKMDGYVKGLIRLSACLQKFNKI